MRVFKVCLSILRMQFLLRLQFRAAVWAKVSTFVFWGFVHTVLLLAFYRYGAKTGAGISGMSVSQAVSYGWLTQIVGPLMPIMTSDSEIWEKIRKGDVGIELCRPLDLYVHWYARAIAARISPFLLQLVPVTAIAMLLPAPYNLRLPASLQGLLASLLSISVGLLLSCACVVLSQLVLMNVNWGEGPTHLVLLITDLLSGSFLPLQLWPGWAQKILYLQPFAGIIDIPLRLYTGTMPPGGVLKAIFIQLFWALLLTFAGWLWMKKKLNRLVIQGG